MKHENQAVVPLREARDEFVSQWGVIGSAWGINRTMAQIHALLLISPDPLTQDDIMEGLNISRGNTNMNIRELINWGLVDRVILSGERKEFFTADVHLLSQFRSALPPSYKVPSH